jgi:hypothetical protein
MLEILPTLRTLVCAANRGDPDVDRVISRSTITRLPPQHLPSVISAVNPIGLFLESCIEVGSAGPSSGNPLTLVFKSRNAHSRNIWLGGMAKAYRLSIYNRPSKVLGNMTIYLHPTDAQHDYPSTCRRALRTMLGVILVKS